MITLGLGRVAYAKDQQAVDTCSVKIPESLGRVLSQRFPGHRLPLMTDSLEEDVRSHIANGGDGCLLVGSADFNGDGSKDVAVGLTAKDGKVPVVAVAFLQKNGWLVSTIASWVATPQRLYVDTVEPGTYTRTESFDGPLEPTERRSLRCAYPALIVGATESTGIVYCYVGNRWLYVWVAN